MSENENRSPGLAVQRAEVKGLGLSRHEKSDSRPDWLDEEAYPFISHYMDIDGNHVHYVDEGQGPTLVFLHQVTLWSYEFRNIIKELRDRFRCIALDYPGVGLSEAAEGFRNSIRADSALVEAFIRKLGLGPVTLVASEGSVPIGIAVAERNPESVTGLVLSGGFAWPLGERAFGNDRMSNMFSKFIATKTNRFLTVHFNMMNWYTLNFFPEKGRLTPADKRAYYGPFREKSRRHNQVDLLSIARKDPAILAEVEQRAKVIAHVPVLILSGEFDPTHKAGWHERLARMFPNPRVDTMKGAAHFPAEYSPGYFASSIERWWDEAGPGRGPP